MSSSQEAASAAVRRLLATVVDSFEKLEVVVLVYRAQPAARTTASIASALSLTTDEAKQVIAELHAAGVIVRDGTGWVHDATSRWARDVDELVAIYDRDRIEVLKLMTALAIERVRSQAANVFADAFLLRPRKKRDPER